MKTNLIIDGNYLLHKDVFILFSEKTLYSDLPFLLRKDIDRLSKMHNFDHVYFVSDSKMRWRSEIYEDYKSERTPHENIDWTDVYQIFDELKLELKKRNNIHFYEVDWAEGDDLIAYITNESNKKGYSNILMASDNDFQQLVKFDLGLEYINLIYNYRLSDEKTYFPKNYNIFLEEMYGRSKTSLFDMNEDTDFLEFLEYLKSKTKIYEADHEKSLFSKIISGDKKDNVSSVYIKNDRGIGIKGAESIYKLYKETNDDYINFHSNDIIDEMVNVVAFNKKIKDDEIKKDIKNKILRNRELIMLSEKYLPKDLYENIKNTVKIY